MRTSTCYMRRDAEGTFWNDAPTARMARMYHATDPIFLVRVTERDRSAIDDNERGTRAPNYWGWWETVIAAGPFTAKFEMIWPKRFMVDMCFTYGAKAEEERGRGHLLPVTIEILEEVKI